jgi:hypothetical protein
MIFCNHKKALEILAVSESTLKRLRKTGALIEGTHYVRMGDRVLKYNRALLEDWLANQGNPQAHDRAIAAYFASLPSSTTTKRSTRKTAA